MITAKEARTRTFTNHQNFDIINILEDIEITILFYCTCGDTEVVYGPRYNMETAQIDAVLYYLRASGYRCKWSKRGYFIIKWQVI